MGKFDSKTISFAKLFLSTPISNTCWPIITIEFLCFMRFFALFLYSLRGRKPTRRSPDPNVAYVRTTGVHDTGVWRQTRRAMRVQTSCVWKSADPTPSPEAFRIFLESQHAQVGRRNQFVRRLSNSCAYFFGSFNEIKNYLPKRKQNSEQTSETTKYLKSVHCVKFNFRLTY